MKKRLDGFTLIEVLVVVLIIGILATISITYYAGSVEDEKLDSAAAQVQAIASAENMYALANNGSYSGDTSVAITNNSCLITANSACPTSNSGGIPNSGNLLAAQNWANFAYDFYGGSSSCLSWATRKTSGEPGGTSSSPYTGWIVCVLPGGNGLCGTNTSCASSCSSCGGGGGGKFHSGAIPGHG
jgi:prepilin-type N-terminal cleavage/methylation domain-containing protein